MTICPITYEECGRQKYSSRGLKSLSPRLKELNDFPYDAESQRREAAIRASKMSIQGIQPKLSVRLSVRQSRFEIANRNGHYIIKPQHHIYPQLPQNEDLTMRLAAVVDITVPLHGLIYCQDETFSYFIKRFDRIGSYGKIAVEDFAQLAGMTRKTKYNYSMEKVVNILDERCTFPAIEKVKLFKRSLFNFIVGNEDMHLKNFSLITKEEKVELSPAYDFLNSFSANKALGKSEDEIEEIALPLRGKKKNLTRKIWIDYFGMERCGLNVMTIDQVLEDFMRATPRWKKLIGISFLSPEMKKLYQELVDYRSKILGIKQHN
ncbi:MAG: HipA domain-containing protein [Candidatus Euphemobacter frigidus]|nr:HipA domain-containing protein [Candidatus Euphemobacter frigidus]MDP8276404.1 HipA domain-containing protein [Candidatus Euphemobacter frigidus]